MIYNGALLTSIVMFAIFGGMAGAAATFTAASGFLPLVIGIPGTILCGIQVIVELTSPQKPDTEGAAAADHEAAVARERVMFGWLFGFFAGVLAFGFLYAAPVLVFAFLYFKDRERLWVAAAAAAVSFAVLYGAFARLLELTLFEGLVPLFFFD